MSDILGRSLLCEDLQEKKCNKIVRAGTGAICIKNPWDRRVPDSHQKLEEMTGFLPSELRERIALPTP